MYFVTTSPVLWVKHQKCQELDNFELKLHLTQSNMEDTCGVRLLELDFVYLFFKHLCVCLMSMIRYLGFRPFWGSPVPSSQFHPGKFPMEDKAYNDIKKPGFCIKTRFSHATFCNNTWDAWLGWAVLHCEEYRECTSAVDIPFLLSAESPALGVKRAARDSVMYTFPGPLRFPSWLHSKYWNVYSWHVHVLLLSWWAKSKRSIGIESRMHWCQMFKAQNASSAGQNQQWPASTLLLNSPF